MIMRILKIIFFPIKRVLIKIFDITIVVIAFLLIALALISIWLFFI